MLIEFRVGNFKSFKDEQVFSMVASSDNSLLENIQSPPSLGKQKLVSSAVIYGHSAAGKSNFIEAIRFAEDFITNSISLDSESEINVQPFLLNNDSTIASSLFEFTFLHQNTRYQYGFTVDRKRVYEEWLIAYPKGLPQSWFERKPKPDSEDSEWYFGPRLSGEKVKLQELTRKDALFLSVAVAFNNKQLLEVYRWFSAQLRFFNATSRNPFSEMFMATKIKEDGNYKEKVRTLLQKADLGIIDFMVEEKQRDNPIPSDMPAEFQRVLKELNSLSSSQTRTEVQLKHKKESSNDGVFFPWNYESLGTRKLFNIAGPLFDTLEKGYILVVDELDTSLHPVLVKALIEMFHNPEINQKGAQLIFNTHNTILLDTSLFRRDQIWFVEKDNSGVSHLYPLLDFRPRKDEALQKGYLQGRYGAIPIIDGLAEVATTSG